MPGDKVNFNLYNLSGDMLAFLREDDLNETQQGNILEVLGLTTEGLEGPPGPNGLSAYALAVENGYTGDETSWLASLEGPEGPQGQSSTELLKPYLYNKYLEETIFPGYWTLEQWNSISGPNTTGFQEYILPDGVEAIYITTNFTLTLTYDSRGYDPFPFSLTYIGPSAANISPLDRSVIDSILYTLNNCNVMLSYPASFTRTLDLSTATYSGGSGEGSFFNETLQGVITNIINAGWTIDWPFDGAVSSPYVAVNTFPDLSNINGTYYSQSNGFLYTSPSPQDSTDDMTVVESIATFPLATGFGDGEIYFTYGSDESYYYYIPA